ncbi:MAG: hypothetical protein ACYC1Z_13155 [Georgenia sp.]
MPVSYLPTRTASTSTKVTVGLDLTGLGVGDATDGFSADLPVETANLARLSSFTKAAHDGGVDFVTLGERFRLRSDRAVRANSWLDPVVAVRRISPHAGAAGLVATLPAAGADLSLVAGELGQVPATNGTWTGLQLGDPRGGEVLAHTLEAVSRAFSATRSTRVAAPRVVVPVSTDGEVEPAGSFADVVRIRETDLEWARELRYGVRAAARAAGRDVRVLVDLHTVISGDRDTAQARAALIGDIAGPDAAWAGALSAVGTVADVVELVQTWLQAGGADGFVVLPGSLPADVVALLRGVLPALRSRGLVAERTVAARPAVQRPQDPTHAAAQVARPAVRRPRAVSVA